MRAFRLVTFAFFALQFLLASSASAAEKKSRLQRNLDNARQCLAEIATFEQDAKPVSWTGKCLADDIARLEPGEYRDGSAADTLAAKATLKDPIVLSGSQCKGARSTGADSAACGVVTSGILGSLANAETLIALPGGRCIRYVPLLLSDKTAPYSCTALRARRACVHVTSDADATVVTLSTLPHRKGRTEEFRIASKDVDRWLKANTWHGLSGRLSHADVKTGQLYLIRPATPVDSSAGKGPYLKLTDRIRQEARYTGQLCQNNNRHRPDVADYCGRQRRYHAERIALEAVRVDLNVRHLNNAAERRSGLQHFLDFMSQHKASLSDEEWAFYNVIVYNEISVIPAEGFKDAPYASPYQLLDAVYQNSALSWGAKQIDFWGNTEPLVDDFWKKARKENLSASFTALRGCLSNPGKTLPIVAFRQVLKDAAAWNAGLDSSTMRAFHDDSFLTYVRMSVKGAEKAKSRSPLLAKSLLTRLYYLDQINQKGTADPVVEASKVPLSDKPDEEELCRAEAAMFERYNAMLSKMGQTPYPDRQRKLALVINSLGARNDTKVCKALAKKAVTGAGLVARREATRPAKLPRP